MTVRFDIEISLALSADITADPSTWAWTDITDYAMVRDGGVTITRGRSDWQTTAQPSSCQVLLNNADGRFSRLNPLGVYYGTLSKNTPLRVRACAAGGSLVTSSVGFVSEWPVRWTPGEHHYWVPVRADGVMRRLGQGATPLKSALFRTYLNTDLLAYWPMEDNGPTLDVVSGIPGGRTTSSPVELTFVDGQPGTARALSMVGYAEVFSFPFTFTLPDALGFQVEIVGVCDAGIDTGFLTVRYGTAPGDSFLSLISAALADGDPHHFVFQVVQNGANVDVTTYRDGVFGATTSLGAGTVTTTPTVYLFLTPSAADVMTASHLAIYSYDAMTLPTDRAAAADGYAGELTGVRFARLCAEESVPYDVAGTDVDSYAMGPQTTATLLNLLRECEAAAEGLLIERRTGEIGLDLLTARYNLPVALALDYAQGHIVAPFEPTDDDRLTRNDVTVTRAGGSSAHVEETTGPMGTDPTTGAGLYDEALTLNLDNDFQPLNHASWRVHLGTVNELRYPTVNLKLHKPVMSSLITTWLACDVGSRITIDNMPANMPPDLVDQIIEGYTERIDSVSWDVTLNLSPYSPYLVGVYAADDADSGDEPVSRYDTAGCVTEAGLWLPGASGAYASTPDHASLDIVGDIDLRADVAMNDWTPATTSIFVGKWSNTVAVRSYLFYIDTSGLLNFAWTADGTAVLNAASTVPVPTTNGSRLAVRAILDVNNGAAGKTARFYTGGSTGDLGTVSWTQLGADVTTGGTTSIFSSSTAVQVGIYDGTDLPLNGVVYAAQIRNGIGGTTVASPEFSVPATGTTSFADGLGLTWTVNGTAKIYHNFIAGTNTDMLVHTELGQPWTTDADDLPVDLRCSGAVLEVTAVTGTGHLQVLTVTAAAVNGVAKTITPVESISLAAPRPYAP